MTFYAKKAIILSIIFTSLFLIGCGATSTASRYETKEKEKRSENSNTTETSTDLREDFDLTPFQPEINLPDKAIEQTSVSDNLNVWYEYENVPQLKENKKIIGTQDGYRVQVYATDNLDEANRIKGELEIQLSNQNNYLIFEPPFYKVKVGDFLENRDANSLRFKLSQMGYTESKVVRETINLFE